MSLSTAGVENLEAVHLAGLRLAAEREVYGHDLRQKDRAFGRQGEGLLIVSRLDLQIQKRVALHHTLNPETPDIRAQGETEVAQFEALPQANLRSGRRRHFTAECPDM